MRQWWLSWTYYAMGTFLAVIAGLWTSYPGVCLFLSLTALWWLMRAALAEHAWDTQHAVAKITEPPKIVGPPGYTSCRPASYQEITGVPPEGGEEGK
jgi:hypothetical protein